MHHSPTTPPFGFLPFNKPKGMTSRDLANRVQRRLRRENEDRKLKVGHTGTLDPLASGLMVLSVGSATRLTPWMLLPTKRYTGTFRLGAFSESGDLEEPIVEVEDARQPTPAEIEDALASFDGWINQTPPSHSAIWVDGQRAHERIRRGEELDMPTRRVWIGSLNLIDYDWPMLKVDVTCGSGTYLRSLGLDIATACGTVAVMTDLVRTEIGSFHLDDAVGCIPPNDPPPVKGMPLRHQLSPMVELAETTGSPWLSDCIRLPIHSLSHLPRLELDALDARRVRNGLMVTGDCMPSTNNNVTPVDAKAMAASDTPLAEEILTVDPQGDLVAIMRRKKGQWSPYRVFKPLPTSDELQSDNPPHL